MKRFRTMAAAGLLLVAIPTAAVLAAKPNSTGLENASSHAGKTLPPDHGTRDDEGSSNGEAQANRPHNHGWFVSQVAKDHSVTGRAHGEAVSGAARGSAGKPDTAATPGSD